MPVHCAALSPGTVKGHIISKTKDIWRLNYVGIFPAICGLAVPQLKNLHGMVLKHRCFRRGRRICLMFFRGIVQGLFWVPVWLTVFQTIHPAKMWSYFPALWGYGKRKIEVTWTRFVDEVGHIAKPCLFQPSIYGQEKSRTSLNGVGRGRTKELKGNWKFLGRCKEGNFW